MAEASNFTWYKPAAIASIGAIFGMYALYTAYGRQPETSSLRRSNAVHRSRRSQQRHEIDFLQPSQESPLGVLLLKRNGDVFRIDLTETRLPSMSAIEGMFGPDSDEIRRQLEDTALELVLIACYRSLRTPAARYYLDQCGLTGVIAAIRTRDRVRILDASSAIPHVLGIEGVDAAQLEGAIGVLSESWLGWLPDDESETDDTPVVTEDMDVPDTLESAEPSQGLRGLLYYIAEDDAKRKAYEHRGIGCENCGQMPIEGIRWHCLNCADFDVCASCEAHLRHPKTHVFAKIKIPLPVLSQPTKEYRLWYPGDPRKMHPSIEPAHKKRLCQEHEFEEPQIEAFYDQFTCLANVPWENESSVKCAIDRRAFNKAMTSERWPSALASNALYDRMFAFYDTDSNGVIGFDEFVSGLAYLRGPKRFASLRRCVQGYDFDGDGYVNRSDFLRLLRAKFVIQKQLIDDATQSRASEQTMNGMGTLHSSQPISSIFSEEVIPPGQIRRPANKRPDQHGDLVPMPNTEALLEDDAPFRAPLNLPSHEQPRRNLSRFEELIYGPGGELQGLGQSNDQVTDTRSVMLRTTLGSSNDDNEEEVVEPYVQDLLWHITEEGINSLLDPMFNVNESEDRAAVSTREERDKWRKEIEAERERTRAILAQIKAAREENSSETVIDVESAFAAADAHLGSLSFSDPVPTDRQSLERRLAHISDAPVDVLLETAGFGIREDTQGQGLSGSASAENSGGDRPGKASEDLFNKSGPVGTEQEHEDPRIFQRRPSVQRLRWLATLDDREQNMEIRGGPGRLSYDEVEARIVYAVKGDLRGLIKNWLEWAAF